MNTSPDIYASHSRFSGISPDVRVIVDVQDDVHFIELSNTALFVSVKLRINEFGEFTASTFEETDVHDQLYHWNDLEALFQYVDGLYS